MNDKPLPPELKEYLREIGRRGGQVKKYATDEERLAARRESLKRANAKRKNKLTKR